MKIRVKIVEKDKARCEVLTELLDDALILNGDGTDRQLLLEEGLMTAEAFVTLTNMDEENGFPCAVCEGKFQREAGDEG